MSAKLTTNFKPEVPSGIVAQGAHASTILLYTLMNVLPQSYFTLKLLALVCFLIAHSIMVWYSRSLRVKISDVIFYAATGALGAIWAAVGSFNGNAFGGIGDGVKLYIAWSVLFTAIITLRRNAGALQGLHFTFVTSTFLICGLNFAAVSDVLLGYGYMPTGLIDELARMFHKPAA